MKKYEVHKSHFHRGPLNSDNYESVYLAADVEQVLKQILEPFVEIIEAKAVSQMLYEVPERKHSKQMILDCMPSGLVEPWKEATRLLERLR